MKKDKLYTVNKWNKRAISPDRRVNLFANGGDTAQARWDNLASADRAANPQDYTNDGGSTTEQYMKSKNAFGISKEENPFSKGNLGSITSSSGGAGMGINALAAPVGNLLNKGISGGLSSGAGKAISSLGGTVGGMVGKVNPIAGAAITVGSSIVGGVTNALFGTAVNQEQLNLANKEIAQNNNFKSTADSFDDVKGPTATESYKNPYRSGALNKGWAKKRNLALRTRYRDAKSFASRSVDNNVMNIASDQINDALGSYAAYGGPLNVLANSNMGATEYGLMSDYLTLKDKQTENKGNMIGYLGGNTPTMFALGGDIQTNGSDWTTGLNHVNAGGIHEENPYQGVPMGMAPDGSPNLVEEDETIYNDYVFSNRLKPSKEVLRKLHLSSKSNATYADISKKLEKESLERPNDPISKAALDKMLGQLAEAQEQQKAEEEAMRARKAFEALSPGEQQQVMQQIAMEQQAQEQEAVQQEQAEQQQAGPQQEAAMQEAQMQQGDTIPVDENGNPIGQTMQEVPAEEGIVGAEGGRLHKYDGTSEESNQMQKAKNYRKLLLNYLGLNFESQLDKWAKDNNVGYYMDSDKKVFRPYDLSHMDDHLLEKVLTDKSFIAAASKNNKKMQDAFGRGYDFGVRQYDPWSHATIQDQDNGNFRAWAGNNVKNGILGWAGEKDANGVYSHQSTDDIWTQGLGNYMAKNGFAKGQETQAIDHMLANLDRKTFDSYMADTDAYRETTKHLQDNEDARRQYIYELSKLNTLGDKEKAHIFKHINEKGEWLDPKGDHSYAAIFGGDGTGLRDTYAGNWWHSMKPGEQQKQVLNLAINPDTGEYEEITNLDGYELDGDSLVYNNPDDVNITLNYYKKKAAASPKAPAEPETPKEDEKYEPILKNEKLRYAGLLGPAIGLGLWGAGVGKPDYSGLEAAINASRTATGKAKYRPIGNYLRYRPMDIWREQNRMDANTNATNRAIMNTSGTAGGKMAGLLASGYNSQLGSGELYNKALTYNDTQRQNVAKFNRETDMFNAEAYNKTSQVNAELQGKNAQFTANLMADAAKQRLAADAQWYNGLYGNIAQLTGGIADIGKENAQHNMIARMAADGLFGAATEKQNVMDGYIRKQKSTPSTATPTIVNAAKGGKLKKKRKGLTF